MAIKKSEPMRLTDATPDETTFVRFRTRLREANIHDKLFDAVVNHLDKQGYLVREGTVVDATIIELSRGRNRDDGTSTRDGDASFTKKHGKTSHGDKGHIACDLSGIVTDYRFTTAREHDSHRIDDLMAEERTAVLADSAYSDRVRRAALRERWVRYQDVPEPGRAATKPRGRGHSSRGGEQGTHPTPRSLRSGDRCGSNI